MPLVVVPVVLLPSVREQGQSALLSVQFTAADWAQLETERWVHSS